MTTLSASSAPRHGAKYSVRKPIPESNDAVGTVECQYWQGEPQWAATLFVGAQDEFLGLYGDRSSATSAVQDAWLERDLA